MKVAVLILGCFLIAPVANAQNPVSVEGEAPASTTTFRSGVDLVALNVVVTDAQKRLIANLAASDFAVFEDGVQQDVTYFASSHVPLDLALLLDTSASMSDKMTTMQEAALGFVSTLRPGDRVSIVDIKESVKVLHPLSGDIDAAREAIRSTAARGGTGLYNGVYMTLKDLVRSRRGSDEVRRQAIAVLSDGDDTASLVSFDDVMDTAKESGVAIYTILLRSPVDIRQAAERGHPYLSNSEYSMKALAQETGARAFFPVAISELAGIYDTIAEELAGQYSLGYSSKNAMRNGTYRRVTVKLAQYPNAQARTRAGYVAARSTSASQR